MASEILSNLQLGSLILNASKPNAITANTGVLISAPSATITDSSTSASGTLTQFNAHYLAAPTLAATNTSVTTTSANTLTIGGAPIAGTNETLTNAYALNILGGATNLGGALNVVGPCTLSKLYCAPSWVNYGWANGSNTQSIAATSTAVLNSSYMTQKTQSSDGLLNNIFSGTSVTFPVTGTYAVTWFGRTNNGVTTSQVDFWVQTTSATVAYGVTGYVLSHQAGFIVCGSCSFVGHFVAGETVAMYCYSNSANSFYGNVNGDHTLSILLTSRG